MSLVLCILLPPASSVPRFVNAADALGPRNQELASTNNLSRGKPPPKPDQDAHANVISEYQRLKGKLPLITDRQSVESLKMALARSSPELNVREVLRDAEVSDVRLLNKHGGQVYKFSGLIIETNAFDVTLVIHNTEIVCTFSDPDWKSRVSKAGQFLYAAGLFESCKIEQRRNVLTDAEEQFRQLTFAHCYVLENYSELANKPVTEEDKEAALKEYREALLYKLNRDLTRPKNN